MESSRLGSDGLLASLTCHYDDLIRYIGYRFGDMDLAHDVVHEVCADLLNRPEPAEVRQPLALLRRMLHNRAIDHKRGDAARHRLAEAWADCLIQACHEDAATYLQGLEVVDELAAIIRRLPDRARQVFILHRLYDMPLAAIADELGLSSSAVVKHHAQARRLIRAQWAPARVLCDQVSCGIWVDQDAAARTPLLCKTRES